MLNKYFLLICSCILLGITSLSAQEEPVKMVVKPIEIHDVINNPGIGFMTFQRFNGDNLNEGMGWTEGLPIVYQHFNGDLINKNHPQTSIAYFRVYWNFIEPEQGQYNCSNFRFAGYKILRRNHTNLLFQILSCVKFRFYTNC